jgi:hypothetical protein
MPETPLDRHCESCVFFRWVTVGGALGQCHRFPPLSYRGTADEHAYVTPNNFCGEYKRS